MTIWSFKTQCKGFLINLSENNHRSVKKHTELGRESLQWLNKVTQGHSQLSADGKSTSLFTINFSKIVTHIYIYSYSWKTRLMGVYMCMHLLVTALK